MRTNLTQDALDYIYAQAKQGLAWRQIAREVHLGYPRVRDLLVEAGFQPPAACGRGRGLFRCHKQIAQMWADGYDLKQIATALRSTPRAVRNHLRAMGYVAPNKKPGPKAGEGAKVQRRRCRRCTILLSESEMEICDVCRQELAGIAEHGPVERREEYDLAGYATYTRRARVVG